MIKKLVYSALIIVFSMPYFGQTLQSFNQQQNKIAKIGMLSLGSWSTGTLIYGLTGINSANEFTKAHSQMNVMWSAINLSLALPGFLKAHAGKNVNYNFGKTYTEQTKIEKAFLFNTALDVAYITGGLLLKERANYDLINQAKWNGFGNAIIMQGSFLFAFDLTMAAIQSNHRKKVLDAKLPEQFE